MRHPVRVAVISAAFCINMECGQCEGTHLGGANDYVDCRRRDCDNHQRGLVKVPPPPSTEPPFELPSAPE